MANFEETDTANATKRRGKGTIRESMMMGSEWRANKREKSNISLGDRGVWFRRV